MGNISVGGQWSVDIPTECVSQKSVDSHKLCLFCILLWKNYPK